MNFLFSINRTFIPLLLNCVNSILKNGDIDEYVAYVLHSDLETASTERISRKDRLSQNPAPFPRQ